MTYSCSDRTGGLEWADAPQRSQSCTLAGGISITASLLAVLAFALGAAAGVLVAGVVASTAGAHGTARPGWR